MEKFNLVTEPESLDFYEIYGSEEKWIHIFGYCVPYEGWCSHQDLGVSEDTPLWSFIDSSGLNMPLSEFLDGMKKHEGHEYPIDYIYIDLYGEADQYQDEKLEKDSVDLINQYFDGKPADYYLRFEDININTPVGHYVHKSE